MPVRLESMPATDSDGHGGKAAVWRCTFASPSRQSIKPYTWSDSSAMKDLDRGLTPGIEDSWNPSNPSTHTFDRSYLNIDSDAAWNLAQEHGGDKLLKANPRLPVKYALDWDPFHNNLVWHVIYATSAESAELRVAVDANDGKFLRVEK
jgi:hypothetical protein